MAPAERGPTLKAPAWSTKAIEPPPAPIVCTSIIGTSTGKPGDPGVARGRLAEAAFRHDADVGRGAADIEGDEVAPARERARPVAADHARRRAREQGEHRPLGHHGGRRHAAVGGHDAQVGLEARRLDLRFEARDVVAHLGTDEGVHRRRGEALELAELRRHRGGGGGEALGIVLAHDRHGARLVRRVEIGEQEADGDGLHARFLELAHGLAHAFLVERLQHLALGRHQPLRHRLAMAALDQRPVLPGDVLHDRVVLRPLVAADVQDIAIAAGRDHAGHGAVVLEDGVGGDGGAVEHHVDRLARDVVLVAQRHQPLHDAARGVVGRRRDLVHGRAAGIRVGIDQIRERPAHIDADQPHPPRSLDLPPPTQLADVAPSYGDGGVMASRLRMTPSGTGAVNSAIRPPPQLRWRGRRSETQVLRQ